MTPTKQTTEQAQRDEPGAPVALHEVSGKTPDELWLETGRLRAQAADFKDRIGKAIHYPKCWCTTAYPTLESALSELYSCSKCTNDLCLTPSDEAKDEAEAGIYNVITEAGSLWSILAKYGVEPTSNPLELLSMHVVAVTERETAFETIQRQRLQLNKSSAALRAMLEVLDALKAYMVDQEDRDGSTTAWKSKLYKNGERALRSVRAASDDRGPDPICGTCGLEDHAVNCPDRSYEFANVFLAKGQA